MKHLLSILLTALLCATATAQTIRTLGYNATNGLITATNYLTFNNAVNIAGIEINANGVFFGSTGLNFNEATFTGNGTSELFNWGDDTKVVFNRPIEFSNSTNSATTRTNLSLGLPALTNTSNVTMMRALAGSTNEAHPFSGSFVFVDDSANTWSATVSNGIILSIVEQ